jgi:site-specific DNA-methyltransferase (adenine-specific)
VRAGFERRGEIVRLVMTMRGGDRPKNAHQEFSDVSVMPRSMWEPWLIFRKPLEGRVRTTCARGAPAASAASRAPAPSADVIASHPTRGRRAAARAAPQPQAAVLPSPLVRAVLPLGAGVVLDPFAGAGSTLAAAESVGYASIGVEIGRPLRRHRQDEHRKTDRPRPARVV